MFGGSDLTRTLTLVVKTKNEVQGGNIGKVMGGLGLGIAGAAAAATEQSVKMAAGFDDALTHVKAFAGASDSQIKQWSGAILSMAPTVGLSATNMAEGLYNLASAGVKGKDAMIALKVAAKAAAGSHTDLAVATDVLTSVINTYGLHGKAIAKAQDDLTQTALIGKAEFKDLAASYGQVLPVAQQLGVSTKSLGAMFADLTNKGNSAAESSIMIKNTMQQLLAPTGMQFKMMSALGLTMADFKVKNGDLAPVLARIHDALDAQAKKGKMTADAYAQMQFQLRGVHISTAAAEAGAKKYNDQMSNQNTIVRGLFGGNLVAMRTYFALYGDGGKALHKYNQQMQQDNGITATSLKKASQSTIFQWHQMQATLGVLAIDFGTVLLPAINKVLHTLTPMLTGLMQNKGAFDKVRDATGYVTAAWDKASHHGKDLNGIVDTLRGGVKELSQGFTDMLRPLGLVGNSSQTTKHRVDDLTGGMHLALQGVKFLIGVWKNYVDQAVTVMQFIGATIKKLQELKRWLGDVTGAVGHWSEAGRKMMGGFISAIGSQAGALKTEVVNAVTGAFSAAIDAAKKLPGISWLTNLIGSVKGLFHIGQGGGLPSFLMPGGGGPYTSGSNYGPFGGYSANYVSSNDVAMLNALGVRPLGTVMDTDFPSGPRPVKLPGGSGAQYTLASQYMDRNVGGVEVWRTPHGGTLAFLHLSRLSPTRTAVGEQVVGVSGHPLTTAFGNDPGFYHLCVVTDALGRTDIEWLSTPQMQTIARRAGRQRGGGGVRPTVGTVGYGAGYPAHPGYDYGAKAATAAYIRQQTEGPLNTYFRLYAVRQIAGEAAIHRVHPFAPGRADYSFASPPGINNIRADWHRNRAANEKTAKNTQNMNDNLDNIRRDYHRNRAADQRHRHWMKWRHLDARRHLGLSFQPAPGH